MEKTTKRAVYAYIILAFMNLFYFLTSALLAYIMKTYTNIPSDNITLLVTIPNIVGVVISFVLGPIALKIRKKILVGLIPVTVAVYMILFALFGTSNFTVLIIAAIIAGYPQGAVSVVGIAYIPDFLEEGAQRSKFVGLASAVQSAGAAFSYYIGGIIAARNGGVNWNNAYWIGAIVIIAAIVFFAMTPKFTPAETEHGIGGAKKDGKSESFGALMKGMLTMPKIIIVMAILELVWYWAVSAYNQNISVYIITEYGLGTSVNSGLASAMIRISGFVSGLVFGMMHKKFKNWAVPLGYTITTLGLLCIVIWHTLPACYIAGFLCGFGNSFAFTALFMTAIERAGMKYAAVATAICEGFVNLGTFITPYALRYGATLFGEVNATSKITFGLVVGCVCTVASIFVYIVYDKKKKKPELTA